MLIIVYGSFSYLQILQNWKREKWKIIIGIRKKVDLESGQTEENQNQLHSVSLFNIELEFNQFMLAFVALEQS